MRYIFPIIILIILLLAGAYFLRNRSRLNENISPTPSRTRSVIPLTSPTPTRTQSATSELISKDRITKKPFGKYVEPGNSPVENERFTGFHTAADFETFDDEKDKQIAVKAVCSGPISQASTVSGYGGLLIQDCEFNKEATKVLYGHIDLSFEGTTKAGDSVSAGDQITILAPAFSPSNGNERKHLHLGILKSNQIDYRGYVLNESELSKWYDPVELLGLN